MLDLSMIISDCDSQIAAADPRALNAVRGGVGARNCLIQATEWLLRSPHSLPATHYRGSS
jgi:hypothetical protein